MARPKTTTSTQRNEEKPQEAKVEVNDVKTTEKKQPTARKSKVGNFYMKVKYFESSRDADQITTFDLKGDYKELGEITLPPEHAERLNRSAKWSGIYYKKIN